MLGHKEFWFAAFSFYAQHLVIPGLKVKKDKGVSTVVDWMRKGIIGGVGFLDGYLVDKDQENAATRADYLKRQSNWLRLGGTVIGTGVETFMPRYSKWAAPVADASLALLAHGLYFQVTKKEGETVPFAQNRRTVFVPRHRVSGSPQFAPPIGPMEVVSSGGVPMAATSPRYE